MEHMKLNFAAIADQEQTFKVYRKQVVDTSQSKDDLDYRTKLPIAGESEDWPVFDVSWSEKSGYEPFECHFRTNAHLSETYLFRCLTEALTKSHVSSSYELPKSSKYKEITFVIEKHKEGDTIVKVYPYYLRSQNKAGYLFEHRFRVSEDQNFNRRTQVLSLSLDSMGKPNVFMYRDKEAIIQDFLNTQFKPLIDSNFSTIEQSFTPIPSTELNKKIYLVGREKSASSQFIGIRNFGPYDSINEEIQYIFLFSEKTRSLARDIYFGLIGKLFPAQFPGLSTMFSLPIRKDLVDHYPIPNFTKEEIDLFFEKFKDMPGQTNNKKMLFVVLPKGVKERTSDFDAYSYIKLLSLKHEFYCQVITEDTFYKKDQLKWSISNIGLQAFSKLGGTPWLVKPAKRDCLILGIGSAHEKVEGQIKKFFAYTVCLDSSGQFKYVRPLASDNNENTYLQNLRKSLEDIFKSELGTHYKSFVLHIPFKIRNSEIEAINDVIHTIEGENTCEVIVVKINTQHRFVGFSDHHTRVPFESTLIKLSQNQYLLWAEGRQHGKEVLHNRTSEPLLIDFLKSPESWDGKRDCIQDILNLTGANWRGFNSKAQPISILYSSLIASFMREFSHVSIFNSLDLLKSESTTPWFL